MSEPTHLNMAWVWGEGFKLFNRELQRFSRSNSALFSTEENRAAEQNPGEAF